MATKETYDASKRWPNPDLSQEERAQRWEHNPDKAAHMGYEENIQRDKVKELGEIAYAASQNAENPLAAVAAQEIYTNAKYIVDQDAPRAIDAVARDYDFTHPPQVAPAAEQTEWQRPA